MDQVYNFSTKNRSKYVTEKYVINLSRVTTLVIIDLDLCFVEIIKKSPHFLLKGMS